MWTGERVYFICRVFSLSCLCYDKRRYGYTSVRHALDAETWEVPLMIAVSVLALLLGLDGRIGRADGIGLFFVIIIYSVWCIRQSRGECKVVQEEYAKELPKPVTDLGPLFFQGALIATGVFGHDFPS